MAKRTRLKLVSPSGPCPVCGEGHKCSVGSDGLIRCGRPPGEIPGFKFLGRAPEDDQFGFYRREGDPVLTGPSAGKPPDTTTPKWEFVIDEQAPPSNLLSSMARLLLNLAEVERRRRAAEAPAPGADGGAKTGGKKSRGRGRTPRPAPGQTTTKNPTPPDHDG
jgi:hypothetical protein